MIGKTPLVNLKSFSETLYAKVERANLTGSIKDRIAREMLEDLDSDHVVEATTGNTGISIASVGARMGKKVTIVMQRGLSGEREELIKLLGANVVYAEDMTKAREKAKEIAEQDNGVFLNQFENEMNFRAQYNNGKEILKELDGVDVFCRRYRYRGNTSWNRKSSEGEIPRDEGGSSAS